MNVADLHDSKKARILYIITKANWGGAQKYVFDVATAAQQAGHDVAVACGTQGELTSRLEHESIPVYEIRGLGRDIAPLSDVKSLLSLSNLIKELKPDIVHANSSKAGLIGVMAAKLGGVPRILFTAHGWAFNEIRPLWQKGIFALFHLMTAWLSDDVICVSSAIKSEASWMPFTKHKMLVIHHGIQEIELKGCGEARANHAPHNTETLIKSVWIGTLAELHPIKGLDTAIRAFARIAPQFPQTVLVLIGEGQERNSLVTLASELKLSERIRFCGHTKDAGSYLSALDIFLFPSRSEALGFAVLEAGNASLPVIASRVGGIPEIIEDGVSGILVTPDDVDGFAVGLSSLLAAPALRTKLGEGLHEKVLKDFSKEHALAETLALYTQGLKKKHSPNP
jgi:glycosyltransferase involved in cell wall biosynthesis